MDNKFFGLLANVRQALKIRPRDYIRSILGNPDSWSKSSCPPTELAIGENWLHALHAAAQIVVPALPSRPEWMDDVPGADLFLRRSRNFPFPLNDVPDTSKGRTELFFINGICTDENVAAINAECIHEYFEMPLTVLYNATCGAVPDLVECAFGKGWGTITEAPASAFPPIYAALRNPEVKRVILFGHSQGTIICAVVLELLRQLLDPGKRRPFSSEPEAGEAKAARAMLSEPGSPEALARPAHDLEENADDEVVKLFDWRRESLLKLRRIRPAQLQKLEIYAFANCASLMQPLLAASGSQPESPYIESFGNENDIVAKLGVLAPQQGSGAVRIGGKRYARNGGWGHLLNAHYLWPMQLQLRGEDEGFLPMDEQNPTPPRLYELLVPVNS